MMRTRGSRAGRPGTGTLHDNLDLPGLEGVKIDRVFDRNLVAFDTV